MMYRITTKKFKAIDSLVFEKFWVPIWKTWFWEKRVWKFGNE